MKDDCLRIAERPGDREEWAKAKCDKYDYMIAAFCGGAAGLIDVFFVGDPLSSMLGNSVDKAADGFVKKAAQLFWKSDGRSTAQGKPGKKPESLTQCISYLEQAFPVNFDARYAKDLKDAGDKLSGMRPQNHHLLSLAHSPDPIGLIFSIIDQFTGYASFVDKGKVIRLLPVKSSGGTRLPYLQGSDLCSMIFCGFVNWVGHLISDLAGSSSTRQPGKTGRGAGIPIPFYELFLFCDFGDLDGDTFAEVMIKVFEEGYDLRFGATIAIPVVLEELMIRVIWTIRQKYIRKKTWKESFPSSKHADLRVMLIVGNGTLCAVDGVEAAAHGILEQNVVTFICHLNLIAWGRLVMLVLKELAIRYGPVIRQSLKNFADALAEGMTPAEKKRIQLFLQQMEEYQQHLDECFALFVRQEEEEYRELYLEINETFNRSESADYRAEHSVRLAELSDVEDDKIIRNLDQLYDLF
ncbi:MAG: hypothetical protein LIP12_13290 [Clostridiales bacterium]|nr:hypothetical protein [Clostridiales bacterium]